MLNYQRVAQFITHHRFLWSPNGGKKDFRTCWWKDGIWASLGGGVWAVKKWWFPVIYMGFIWILLGFIWILLGFIWILLGFIWILLGFIWILLGFIWMLYGIYIDFIGIYMDFTGIYMDFIGIYMDFIGIYMDFTGIYMDFIGIYMDFIGIYIDFIGIYMDFTGIYMDFIGIYMDFIGIYMDFTGIYIYGCYMGFIWIHPYGKMSDKNCELNGGFSRQKSTKIGFAVDGLAAIFPFIPQNWGIYNRVPFLGETIEANLRSAWCVIRSSALSKTISDRVGCLKSKANYPLVNVDITMENHHFWWENQLFLWPFSIAILT